MATAQRGQTIVDERFVQEARDTVGKAKKIGALSATQRAEYWQLEFVQRQDEQLTDLRQEFADVKKERDRLRDAAVGSWFQLLGGILIAMACPFFSAPGKQPIGWGFLLSGCVTQVGGLLVPMLVSSHREKLHAQVRHNPA